MEKLWRKCASKASPRPFFLVDNPKQSLYARTFFKSKIFWERIIKNPKLTFFFLSSPVPFNKQSYPKQKEPGTSDQSLFRLRNKFKNISLLVMYYLTKFDDVI